MGHEEYIEFKISRRVLYDCKRGMRNVRERERERMVILFEPHNLFF